MLAIYTATIFLSASLLFLVQPMVAKMVLPVLGGSPAVWNTSMVFFQAVLLGGYLYAHLLTRWLTPARQVVVHAAVVALPLLVIGSLGRLPVMDPRTFPPPGDAPPALWLLGALALAVGGPFFVLATTGPLMQRWFSATTHRHAGDPYFLYAASNIGSMLALLGYPFAMERWLVLRDQRVWFSAGFAVFALMAVGCGALMLRSRPVEPVSRQQRRRLREQEAPPAPAALAALPAAPVSWLTRCRWVALAAVPSSLMLGVTQHISSDIASVPLLWVIPLALYLVTFIVAFGRGTLDLGKLSILYLALAAALSAMMLARMGTPVVAVIGTHILTFFLGSLICHGRLARERPDPVRLTEFYLLIALGGVLGGSFNALLAPVVFNDIAEYPLAIVGAALLVYPSFADKPGAGTDLPRPAAAREAGYFVLVCLAWGAVFTAALVALLAYEAAKRANPDATGLIGPFEFWIIFAVITAGLGAYAVRRARVHAASWDVMAPLAALLTYGALQLAFRDRAPEAVGTVIGGWPAAVIPVLAAGALAFRLARPHGPAASRVLDVIVPAMIALNDMAVHRIVREAGLVGGNIRFVIWYGLTMLLLFFSLGRRSRAALAILATFGLMYFYSGASDPQLLTSRTFFGVHRVSEDARGNWRVLSHGTTRHGMQATDPDHAMKPTMYYHPTGPIGKIFASREADPAFDQVAIIGLGTGGLAAYGQPHQTFTYYEIDPEVVRIARETKLFTFLERSEAKVRIELGDGRLEIAKAPDGLYDLIILDAFSSDAIPIHLITREAIDLYFRKLAPDGMIAFHISNRYLELRPPLGAIARKAGLAAMYADDYKISDQEAAQGKLGTTWVAMARHPDHFRSLRDDEAWPVLVVKDHAPLWTDDYSNILPVLVGFR